MAKRRLQYKFPRLYNSCINLLYFNGLKKIKNMVGKEKSVFDIACGYGRVSNYLNDCCKYSGIDLNTHFVDFGVKKGLDLKIGSIFDEKHYKESDVIVLCDILHHFDIKEMHDLVKISRKFAKEKIIIVEPSFVDIASRNKAIGKFFSWIDSDGINRIEKWLSRKEYDELFSDFKNNYGFSNLKIEEHRMHYFVELKI